MKISDEGLKEIISLGQVKKTSTPGLYFLYEWDGVSYIAVPNMNVNISNEFKDHVKVLLNPEQFQIIDTAIQPTVGVERAETDSKAEPQESPLILSNSPFSTKNFESTTSYYETTLLLALTPDKKSFVFKESYGTNPLVKNFKCTLDKASPLKIVFDTKKPFHGPYSPIENFNECLEIINVNHKNLWITAYPLFENNEIKGAVLSFSHNTELSTSVLESFEESKVQYLNVLNL
jgi:hypothetical protein